ncbi:(d)CMP kinase [bacterium]|nr:(d)CMP kinase [bacterium]
MGENNKIVVAIDGPAGAGKTTAAKMVAEKAGYKYIDTGAMYRALTLLALMNNTSPEDEDKLASLLDNHDIQFINSKLFLDGVDVSREIRSQEVTNLVSAVCKHRKVREFMVEKQRDLARGGGVVMEGRDIGTVVLPDAELKIFLKAALKERALRRKKDFEMGGESIEVDTLIKQIDTRDRTDSQREIAPLSQAEDAVVLDNTDLSIDKEIELILNKIHELEKKKIKIKGED